MVSFTRADPAEVDPASQTSSSFAASLSEQDQHVAEQARQLRVLGGLAVEGAHDRDRDRELERRCCGEACPRIPRGATAGAEVLHVDAGRPAVTRDEQRTVRASDGSSLDERWRGSELSWEGENGLHDARRAAIPAVDRSHANLDHARPASER